MTIVEFLLARISEDEEVALPTDRTLKLDGHELGDECSPVWVTINRARVLAECEAKRHLVTELSDELSDDPSDFTAGNMLKWLAKPYSTHSDFRPGWVAV